MMDKNWRHSLVERTMRIAFHMYHYIFNIHTSWLHYQCQEYRRYLIYFHFFSTKSQGNMTDVFETCTHNKNILWATFIGRFTRGASARTPPTTHQFLCRVFNDIHCALEDIFLNSLIFLKFSFNNSYSIKYFLMRLLEQTECKKK